jgi:hypothetical protein
MSATALTSSPLEQWRKRLGGRRRHHAQARPLAALGYLIDGPVPEGLVEIEKLTIILLYDEQLRPGHCALRLAGYAGRRVPWGVRFGGPGQCRFFKDLSLQPVAGAGGCRLDLASEELLLLGLRLERQLDRHARYRPRRVQPQLRLPKFWAGFRAGDAASIIGDGPELAGYSQRTGKSPRRLLAHLRRDYLGLALFPLAWVSHHWQQAVAIFADLERFPQWQVFRLRHLTNDLSGFQGAAEFDFAGHSRRSANRRRRSGSRHQAAMASA